MNQRPHDPGTGPQPMDPSAYRQPAPPQAAAPPPAAPPPAAVRGPFEVNDIYREGIGYALWCLWLFGLGGIHRIYLGKYGTGVLWLVTFGLFGIGQFCDLFRMKRLVRDANIREGYVPHPRLASRFSGQAAGPAGARALAPPESVQHTLLRAAQSNGGALTVTQGVVATGMSFEAVEEALREMVAKGYVDVDNAPHSGVVVYRFPELAGPFN